MMMTVDGDMRSEVRHMCTREKENIGKLGKLGKIWKDNTITREIKRALYERGMIRTIYYGPQKGVA